MLEEVYSQNIQIFTREYFVRNKISISFTLHYEKWKIIKSFSLSFFFFSHSCLKSFDNQTFFTNFDFKIPVLEGLGLFM